MSNFTDAELLPFGWAPGGYSMICGSCREANDYGSDKRSARCRQCAERLAVYGWRPEPRYLSPEEALSDLLIYAGDNECHHENTHRGGVQWTICEDCGAKWADDRGGFKPYVEPGAIREARRTLSKMREGAL